MTREERVSSLHERMEARTRMRSRRRVRVLSSASVVLAACLFLVIFQQSAAHVGGTAGMYSGATMLLEDAGAYVLVALLAFMIGVVVTILCLRRQRNEQRKQEKNRNEETEEST